MGRGPQDSDGGFADEHNIDGQTDDQLIVAQRERIRELEAKMEASAARDKDYMAQLLDVDAALSRIYKQLVTSGKFDAALEMAPAFAALSKTRQSLM